MAMCLRFDKTDRRLLVIGEHSASRIFGHILNVGMNAFIAFHVTLKRIGDESPTGRRSVAY